MKKALLNYLVYLGLFIGAGFIAGATVHFPLNHWRFGLIGLIGAIIFAASSTLNEYFINNRNLKEEGVAKIIIYSLIISIGIGMISGAIQHFNDIPGYASYLIPGGLGLSFAGFILKNNYSFTTREKVVLIGGTLMTMLLLWLVGSHFAHELTPHSHTEI